MESAQNIVLQVENLGKKFCRSLRSSMAYGVADVIREMFSVKYDRRLLRKNEFHALNDINFELARGDALGIIGQNGSGKTTLLRILNGIFPPDQGIVKVYGRIGALIAVGAGFHPHMTGRENIFLNGTILGMPQSTIKQRFDEIVDFADIGDFLDAPVATYSSGMTVRLGFAIAIFAEPEILLADEVLAVGDLKFTLKCYHKIAEYRRNGGALVLVSHSMQLIRNVCPKTLWIDRGRCNAFDDSQVVCDQYERDLFKLDSTDTSSQSRALFINNDPTSKISFVEFYDKDYNNTRTLETGSKLHVRIAVECNRNVGALIVAIALVSVENITVLANFSNFDAPDLIQGASAPYCFEFTVNSLALKPGRYDCTVTLCENILENVLDWHERAYTLVVIGNGKTMYGLYQPLVEWKLVDSDSTCPNL